MSNEMLSQDEIDALLRQVDGNLDNDNNSDNIVNVDEFLSPMEQDALGEIGNISFGSASTALSTLLGQKVEITTPTVSAISQTNLKDEFPTPHVSVHVNYTDGFEGINLLVIKAIDAKIIADLMLGGTGIEVVSEELSDMDVSAVQEAMNQMMGSSATSMSTIFNMMVNISPPGVDVLDVVQGQGYQNIPNDDVLIKVSFRLKIGDLIDSNIMQLTTIPFAKTMVNKLFGAGEETTTSTSPVVKEEPVQQPAPSPKPRVQENVDNHYTHQHEPQPKSQRIQPNVHVQPAQFTDFEQQRRPRTVDPNLDILMDIPLQITVELGRTKKLIKDILELAQGSIIELDKLAGEPVDILANKKLIAKGEVVVIDENFGVRITDIISQSERISKLQ